jgi:uncharacterized protein (UPF0212 family)
MDCRVVLEAAVPVYDVSASGEAIRIAIAKTGEMLNPDLSHVEIDTADRTSPSGEPLEPAFVVADEALVALELEMTVFAVDRPEHAERVARKESGQHLDDVPLSVLTVEDVTDETGDSSSAEDDGSATPSEGSGEAGEAHRAGDDDRRGGADGHSADDGRQHSDGTDDDVLPEFEELL